MRFDGKGGRVQKLGSSSFVALKMQPAVIENFNSSDGAPVVIIAVSQRMDDGFFENSFRGNAAIRTLFDFE